MLMISLILAIICLKNIIRKFKNLKGNIRGIRGRIMISIMRINKKKARKYGNKLQEELLLLALLDLLIYILIHEYHHLSYICTQLF